ncbi:MAG: hypothetical protein Tsb0026_19560 [Sulfuricaulis sp.]
MRTLSMIISLALSVATVSTPATGQDIADANAVPHLNDRGRREYREYLKAEMHRAFVIAPGGAWAWMAGVDTPEEALGGALAECNTDAEQTCLPYALNDNVVLDEKKWSTLWGPYLTEEQASIVPEGTHRGELFPDLVLVDPKGRPFKVSDLRGKIAVLHFWGTWCPSCVHELPQFVKLRQALSNTPDVVFVFSQVREPLTVARQWLTQKNLNLPLYDSGSHSAREDRLHLSNGRIIADRALAPAFPTTYVLDRYGIVVFSLRGSATDWLQYAAFLRDAAARSGKP